MKYIHTVCRLFLIVPFLMSVLVSAQELRIENMDPNSGTPLINEAYGYTVVVRGVETLVPRGDSTNWTITGGQIVSFDQNTDEIVIKWTTTGQRQLTYSGLTRYEFNSGPPDFTTEVFENVVTTNRTIDVKDLNDVSTYFDEQILYQDCTTAILMTRTDIPDTEEWYWQFTPDGESKALKADDDGVMASETQRYYLRVYSLSNRSWSEAKRVEVDFNNVPPSVTRTTWYADTDNDGYGDPNSTPIIGCNKPNGYINNNLDKCPSETGKNLGCATENYIEPVLSEDENYVYTAVPRVPIRDIQEIQQQQDVIEGVVYHDGLGRVIKSIAIGQSPSKNDIIKLHTYDDMGRQKKQYLPYVATTTSGAYNNTTNPDTANIFEITKFYENYLADNGEPTIFNNVVPYSETLYDNTPYNKPLKQAAPGKDWEVGSGHEIELDQAFNAANEVRKYRVSYIANDLTTPTLVEDGFYAYKALEKSIVTDEHGVVTETYVNRQGQTVLNRKAGLDTYSIYDDYGNLSYVLSPKIMVDDGVSATELSELGYQYIYNGSGRVIRKKDPGKGWEQIVYNYLGQPVLAQSARLKEENKWVFTKYDYFGRVVYTGIYVDARSRSLIQAAVDALPKDALYETKTTTPIAGFQGQLYYTNTIFPKVIEELHTINYYDTYAFNITDNPLAIAPISVYAENITNNTQDFATGSKTKVLGTDQWITSLIYYDTDGNPIYTYTGNPYLETVDVARIKLDFTGNILKSRSYHKKGNATAIVTQQLFTYDHTGRLLDEKQCIGDHTLSETCGETIPQSVELTTAVYETTEAYATQSIVLKDGFAIKATETTSLVASIAQTGASENVEVISSNQYDELGQLVNQKVGNTRANPLQDISYQYNIRGWLTQINNPNEDLNGDLFAYKINYNKTELAFYGTTKTPPLYNGNISETLWKTVNDPKTYGYSYGYDNHNRLLLSSYFSDGTIDNESFSERAYYDKNGNITEMRRYKENSSMIDHLAYTYDQNGVSNKLLSVLDQSNQAAGFKDGTNTGNDYTYDIDGNMIRDLNKGIDQISYNHLDLPTEIKVITNGQTATTLMVYTASGDKLSKTTTFTNGVVKTTKYAGSYVYIDTNEKPAYIHFSEGYIEPKTTSGYQYIYQYKDHLGNIRLSYADNNGNGTITIDEIREEKHYYAFGLQHQYAGNDPRMMIRGRKHTYGFNGIEYNEDLGANFYEMPLRSYDPTIARWTTQDPVIHHMYSPYSAFDNNPVYWADPSGANGQSLYGGSQGYVGSAYDILPDSFYRDLYNNSIDGTKWSFDSSVDGFVQVGGGGFLSIDGSFSISATATSLEEVGLIYRTYGGDFGNGNFTRGTINSAHRQIINNIQNGYVQEGYRQGEWIGVTGVLGDSGWRDVPLIGGTINSIDWFARGDYSRGFFYAAEAISDAFLVKSLVTGAGKLVVRQLAKQSTKSIKNFAGCKLCKTKMKAIVGAGNSFKIPRQVGYKNLKKMLNKHGFKFVRNGKGDHKIWKNTITGKNMTIPDHKQISKGVRSTIQRWVNGN